MYEWVVEEMGKIRTRKFFLVDGPASAELRNAIDGSGVAIPSSYKAFVLQFGNANLYRMLDYYLVRVYAAPRKAESEQGEQLLNFGRADDSFAYFKESLLATDHESPVFEWQHGQALRKCADSFDEWLEKKCTAARRRYTKKEWTAIENGPAPFSPQEKLIVEARRKFSWRVVGISSTGAIQFEVHNGSDLILPFLSIGIRGKRRGTDATLEGGIWLPVDTALPGRRALIEKACYLEWVDPEDVEVFEKPDPEPEDRDRYWEFRPLSA